MQHPELESECKLGCEAEGRETRQVPVLRPMWPNDSAYLLGYNIIRGAVVLLFAIGPIQFLDRWDVSTIHVRPSCHRKLQLHQLGR